MTDYDDDMLNEAEPDQAEGGPELEAIEDMEAPDDLLVEVDTLRASLDERTAELRDREARERGILDRYREALAASDPDVTVDDITGTTIEEIDESFAAARDLALRVRASTAAEAPSRPAPVPAGAPGRRETAPRTPFDKIRSGLAAMD